MSSAVQRLQARGAELEFELVDSSRALLFNERRGTKLSAAAGGGQRRRPSTAPFASVAMQAAPGARQHVPAFVVASAAEGPKLNLEGVPQWRIAAGNLAAGATAGCAVEAGAWRGLLCVDGGAVGCMGPAVWPRRTLARL